MNLLQQVALLLFLLLSSTSTTSTFIVAEDLDHDPYTCALADNVNKILDHQEKRFLQAAKQNFGGGGDNSNNKKNKPAIGQYENDLFWAMSLSGTVRGMPCLEIRAGWWSYEFCFGRFIRQFHEEPNNNNNNNNNPTSPIANKNQRIVHSEFILGLGAKSVLGLKEQDQEGEDQDVLEEETTIIKPDYVVANRPIRYADGVHTLQRKIPRLDTIVAQGQKSLMQSSSKFRCTRGLDRHMQSQKRMTRHSQGGARAVTFGYKFGTVCDLTRKHREVDVVLVCEKEEDLLIDWNITENSPSRPCHYTSFVFGRAVCNVLRQAGLDGSPTTTINFDENENENQKQQQSNDDEINNNINNNGNDDNEQKSTRTSSSSSSPLRTEFSQEEKRKFKVKLARIIGQDKVDQLSDAEIIEGLQAAERQHEEENKLKPTRYGGDNENDNDESLSASLEQAKKIFEKVLNEQQQKSSNQKRSTVTKTTLITAETKKEEEEKMLLKQQQQQQQKEQQLQFPDLTKEQEDFFKESMMFST